MLVAAVEALGLSVEVLVNNAGSAAGGAFHRLDLDREVAMVRTQLRGGGGAVRPFVPEMVERGARGACSTWPRWPAFQPLARQATYGATKAFVLSFTDALHGELSRTGVTATTLCPGATRTEFFDEAAINEEATGLPGFMWEDASVVAEKAVEGLEKGRRVVIPGRANAVVAFSGQHVPRGALVRLADRFYPIK